jgi:hypothetical protein
MKRIAFRDSASWFKVQGLRFKVQSLRVMVMVKVQVVSYSPNIVYC